MTLEEATRQLGRAAKEGGVLDQLSEYISFSPRAPRSITLDGEFTARDLEAIAVWMRAHGHES